MRQPRRLVNNLEQPPEVHVADLLNAPAHVRPGTHGVRVEHLHSGGNARQHVFGDGDRVVVDEQVRPEAGQLRLGGLGGAALTSTTPGRRRWTASAMAWRYIWGETVTSTRVASRGVVTSRGVPAPSRG